MPLDGGMTDQRRFAVVILAAGQGTRMRSDTHKVLHPIASRPLLLHLLDRVDALGADKRVVVSDQHANRFVVLRCHARWTRIVPWSASGGGKTLIPYVSSSITRR